MRVSVKGKPAHVGLQYLGVNAFERMIDIVQELRRLKRDVERRKMGYQISPDVARQSILMLGGEVHGGTNFNVVPAECIFTLERRFNPEEDFAAEKRKLLAILDRVREKGMIDIEILQEGRAAGFSQRTPLAQALAESIHAVTGRSPRFEMCPGLLEIRFYAEKQIPAYAYGPGLLSVSHGPNEFVPLTNVGSCASVYVPTALRSLAGTKRA
jgi:succinyl-diaminopimelate desuccinylase